MAINHYACVLAIATVFAIQGGKIVTAEENIKSDYQSAIDYLIQDGILTEEKIKEAENKRGKQAIIDYARRHGWKDGAAKDSISFNKENLKHVDLDALFAPPTKEEIQATWDSSPKKFKVDRFEFLGEELDWGEGAKARHLSYYSEGLKIYGYIYLPEGEGPFPTLIFNHGGFGVDNIVPPEKRERQDQSGTGRPLSTWCYELAKEGYVVLVSSFRGTRTTMGMSEGNKEGGRGEVTDVLNLLACAKTLPYVDGERIGMLGTSHGGWITALAAQRSSDIKAGIPFFPPADLMFGGRGEEGARSRIEAYMRGRKGQGAVGVVDEAVFMPYLKGQASLAETRIEMIARTIHLFAEHTQCPLLIVCGDKDDLYQQSVNLYETLKKLGKPCWFEIFPGEGHGLTYRGSKAAIERSWRMTLEFFNKHLGEKPTTGEALLKPSG